VSERKDSSKKTEDSKG